jgi:NADH-quinone oxidoreductase subunit C
VTGGLATLVSGALPDAIVEDSLGVVTATVTGDAWVAAAVRLRDDPGLACGWPDWLAASDEVPRRPGDPDGSAVVVRAWSPRHRHAVLLRTLVARVTPSLATLAGVWPGLGWHERETAELHGITFVGHPDPRPLLLPDDPDAATAARHPLRKDSPLVARLLTPWPGSADPGGSRGRVPAPYGRDG